MTEAQDPAANTDDEISNYVRKVIPEIPEGCFKPAMAALRELQKDPEFQEACAKARLDPPPPKGVVTACCRSSWSVLSPHPVRWNPYNQVVQCHNCGHVYEPVRVIADDASHRKAIDDLVAMIEEWEKRKHPPHLGDGA